MSHCHKKIVAIVIAVHQEPLWLLLSMACCKKISCRNLYYTVERPRTATSFPALFFGGQSIRWLLFKLLCNGHFLLSLRWLSKTFITNCDVVITICDSLVYQPHGRCEAHALRAREAFTLLLRYTKTIMRKKPTVLRLLITKRNGKLQERIPLLSLDSY